LNLHRHHLEKLVVQRTTELQKAHSQLLHSEKLSALGKLTGSIAHEFNNPLYGVRNIVEQALEQLAHDEEFNPLLTLALKECDRMADMIRRLQGFYRPSDGIKKWVDIHQALDDMALMLKKQLKTHKTELKKNYSPALPEANVVEDQIKQVFLNLLQNASDAIPPEGGTITVTTESPDSNTIKISIADTGEGIPLEKVRQVEAKKLYQLSEEKKALLEEKEALYKQHSEIHATLDQLDESALEREAVPAGGANWAERVPVDDETLRVKQTELTAMREKVETDRGALAEQ
jgi:phosphoglycerate-specific signal transduction histidine kinase